MPEVSTGLGLIIFAVVVGGGLGVLAFLGHRRLKRLEDSITLQSNSTTTLQNKVDEMAMLVEKIAAAHGVMGDPPHPPQYSDDNRVSHGASAPQSEEGTGNHPAGQEHGDPEEAPPAAREGSIADGIDPDLLEKWRKAKEEAESGTASVPLTAADNLSYTRRGAVPPSWQLPSPGVPGT